MSYDNIGEKERQVRALREQRFAQRNAKKPSTADLRKRVAAIKPMTRKGGRRGR